jgi:methionyl-tRNA formyltransferase
LQGDTEAGVSIMKLDAGIDTGDVLLRQSIALDATETTGILTRKLASLGAEALLATLPDWFAGRIQPDPQDESRASHTRMLKKEDGRTNWQLAAITLARQARAFAPWPGLYTSWNGKLLKLLQVSAVQEDASMLGEPGCVRLRSREEGGEALEVVTGDGLLALEEVQLEGKKAMKAAEFLRGYRQIVGQILT